MNRELKCFIKPFTGLKTFFKHSKQLLKNSVEIQFLQVSIYREELSINQWFDRTRSSKSNFLITSIDWAKSQPIEILELEFSLRKF